MESFSFEHAAELEDYEDQKEYVENYFCANGRTGDFIRIDPDGSIQHLGQAEMKKLFGSIKCIIDERYVSFFREWTEDAFMKRSEVVFKPYGIHEEYIPERNELNTFSGMGKDWKRVSYDKEDVERILAPFMNIGIELVGGNPQHWLSLLQYFAHIIQHPTVGVCFCVCIVNSPQGVGKDLIMSVICKLIGMRYSINSGNPDDFFGEFATGLMNKIIAVFNETEYSSAKKRESKIKCLVTNDQLIFNIKGCSKPVVIQNYVCPFLISNHRLYFDGQSGDRRFVVFTPSEKFADFRIYNHQYWGKVSDHFKSPKFLTALFDYLSNLKVDDIDWKKWHRDCITQEYIDTVHNSLPPLTFFLYHKLNTCFKKYSSTGRLICGKGEYVEECDKGGYSVRIKDYRLTYIVNKYMKKRDQKKMSSQEIKDSLSSHYKKSLVKIQFDEKLGETFFGFNTTRLYKYIKKRWFSFTGQIDEVDQRVAKRKRDYVFKPNKKIKI